jgi:hypothetical protein
MLLGITLRRFVRSLAIAVAAVGLVMGAGVGLATPAEATTGFTAQLANGGLTQNTEEADFSGTKDAGSTVAEPVVDIGGNVFCDGLGAGSTTWTCSLQPSDGFNTGHHSAQFVVTNADGTVSTQVLAFVVYPYYQQLPVPVTSPAVGYQFSPGAVTVTSAASGGANEVSTTFTGLGEGTFDIAACPDGVNSDHPFGTTIASSVSCDSGPLDGGLPVVVKSEQGTVGAGASPDQSNGFFYIPYSDFNAGTQQIESTVDATARTVTVTGALGPYGDSTDAVVVVDGNGAIVCSTTDFTSVYDATLDDDVDQWSCTTSVLGFGNHVLTAAVQDTGGAGEGFSSDLDEAGASYGYYVPGALSPGTAAGTVDFTQPTGPGTGPVTSPGTGTGTQPTDATPDWSFIVSGDLTNLHPGDTITISGTGLPPGTTLDSVLHSIPTDLGTVVAAADGSFTQTVTIPQDVVPGAHTIQVTATGPGIVSTTKQQAVTITTAPASGSGDKTVKPPSSVHSAGTGAGTGTGGNAAIAPNILTRALTPFADVAVHPNKIVSAIEIGLILLLLAVLPAHLLNATIAEQSDRFERRFKRFPKRPRWLTALIGWFTSAPVAAGLVVTLATAILFGFADPTFGWTLASLRLILACGIALFLVGYVANALTAVIARNQWHITVLVSTRPYGLILTVVGVLVSRLLHFSPGFLIGLILGLTIQGKSASGFAWRTVATRTSIVLLMSIAAWIGYSTLTLGGNEGGTFGTALLVETLVAITTEGVVALLVELLPLRFLEGERLYAHSRVLWGILYFLTVVVFVLAVIPWEGNWDALGSSLWIWLIVLAVFAAICVGVYIYFRRFAPPLEEEAGSEEVALGETVGGEK